MLASSTLRTAAAFIKRDLLIAVSYKTAFAADLLSIVFQVTTFYFIGAVIGDGVAPSLRSFGHGYFAFLIVGIALMDFVHTSLETFATSIRDSQTTGTLEAVLLSPIRLYQMVVFSSLWPYLFTAMRFATYMIVGGTLFGLRIEPSGIPVALVILALTILAFAPLGILCASVIMVFKKGAWFRMLINGVSVLLAGVVYPVTVLPPWASQVSYFVPLTHSANGMREALLNGRSLMALRDDAMFLLAFGTLMLPFSLWLFELAVNQTKKLGTLTQY
jgi:ABC-2 type transport system permease protein